MAGEDYTPVNGDDVKPATPATPAMDIDFDAILSFLLKPRILAIFGLLIIVLLSTIVARGGTMARHIPKNVRAGQWTYPQDDMLELGNYLCENFEYPETKDWKHIANGTARPELQGTFSDIYKTNYWDGGAGKGSGVGSEIGATERTRPQLEAFIYKHMVTKFLDAPCGSSNWWPPLLANIRKTIPCFQYRGLDIVPHVVANNSWRFQDDPLTTFGVGDVSMGPLPKGYDAILSRDAMQHLSIPIIIDALEQYAKAEPRYFIIGSYLGQTGKNDLGKDPVNKNSFPINVMNPPFNMTDPIEVMEEGFQGACGDFAIRWHPQANTYLLTFFSFPSSLQANSCLFSRDVTLEAWILTA